MDTSQTFLTKNMLEVRMGVLTLPETNIAPKNGWLEYYFPIGEAYFQGQTVSFREGRYFEGLEFLVASGFTGSTLGGC